MVTATLRGKYVTSGVRPFNPRRDLKSVADLIAAAFRERLAPDGAMALAEMQRIARWGSLLWWLYWPGFSRAGVAPGFVWVERGRVVGNVSLRRALEWGGFFIGNVAVHPDWQGRGIASTLMNTALEAISRRGGRWVGLEVRDDNLVAGRLYARLGFREVGRTLHMLRPAGLPSTVKPPDHPFLRRAHAHDSSALVELVQAIVPSPHRPLLELRRSDYRPGWERTLDCWVEGRHETWWVVEEDGVLHGAVRALRERRRRPDRLEVLVMPEDRHHIDPVLVQRGLAALPGAHKKLIESILPMPTGPLVSALEAAGFHKLRVLLQMRLDLVHRVPVRSG